MTDFVLSLVHTCDANANAKARKYTFELHQRKCKRKLQLKKWKKCHFLALTFALAFAFHTCEPTQGKRKCKRKDNKKPVPSVPSVPCHQRALKLKAKQDGFFHFRREIGR